MTATVLVCALATEHERRHKSPNAACIALLSLLMRMERFAERELDDGGQFLID
jgi:hypothetical protein